MNISREKAIERFEEMKRSASSFEAQVYIDGVIDILKSIQSSDIQGRWVWDEVNERYVCSVCSARALTDGNYRQVLSEYCSFCGTEMDREEFD